MWTWNRALNLRKDTRQGFTCWLRNSHRRHVLLSRSTPRTRSVSKRRLLWKKHLEWFAQFSVALFFRSQRQNTYSTPDTGKPSKNGQFWVFATLVTEPEKRSETKRRRRRGAGREEGREDWEGPIQWCEGRAGRGNRQRWTVLSPGERQRW